LRAHRGRGDDAHLLDRGNGFFHLRIVFYLERVRAEGVERVQLGQFQINDLLILHRTGRGSRRSSHIGSRCVVLNGRSAANTATARSRLVRGIFAPLALGHFVPWFFLLGRLVLWLFCSFG